MSQPVNRGSSTRALGGATSLQVVDVNMSSSHTSAPMTIPKGSTIASFELYSASNTHVGTVGCQISNSGENWTTVTFDSGATTVAVTNGAALNAFINISSLGARYIRLVYTASSGAGTLQYFGNTK